MEKVLGWYSVDDETYNIYMQAQEEALKDIEEIIDNTDKA